MFEIIPAIDVIDGKCVRLTKGNYASKKIYNENPLDVAIQFEDAGLTRLHLVDLDGAKAMHIVNWKILEKISSKTNLHIDFGGGIQSDADITTAFNCGAQQVTAGSIAIKNKKLVFQWLKKYGNEKIILGADVKNNNICILGWTEKTDVGIVDFINEYVCEGARYFICTDIEKDGMLQGVSDVLYKNILARYPEIKLIASGGVSAMRDIEQLKNAGCCGVIIGKAFYEGKITLKQLSKCTRV